MMEHKIVVASTNEGKIKEISKILNSIEDFKITVFSLKDYQKIPEPDEPFESFMDNSIHKAKYYANYTNTATLSEDSGLSIEALDGFPGVKTKDLIKESGGILNAFATLQSRLNGCYNYASYFSSAAVLYIPSQDFLITHEAREYGSVVFPPRGDAGFGFDPIFVPKGYDKTFGELGMELKSKMSHRAKAMDGLMQKFREFIKQDFNIEKNY